MKPLSLTRSALDRVPPGPRPGDGITDLSSDYSGFTVPGPVADAIVWAARSTDLGRHNTAGGHYLRHAIVEKVHFENQLETTEECIVLTAGATAALCFILGALCDAGDSILAPDPGSSSYERLAASWGVATLRYPCALDGTPDWPALEELVEHQTKAIVINSPSDPAGAVLSSERLRELMDFAQAHDLYVISDEQLDMLRFGGNCHPGPASFDTDGRVVSVYSLARSHALAGLRLGYCVAAPPLADAIARAQDSQLAAPSTLALAAGLAALTMDRTVVESMVASYEQMRDVVAVNLPAEVLPFQPQGGYFMLVDTSATIYPDGHAFAAELLARQKVRVAPGPRFGQQTHAMVRLTLAVKERTLGQGIERLATFLEESKA